MTLGFGYALRAVALPQHAAIALTRATSSQVHRPAPVHEFVPGPMVMVAGYLMVLGVLVVFGVCMGWQRQGPNGNGGGGGGGGPRRPPTRDPTPPGGRQLTVDTPPPAPAGDFAAWEGQLQAADEHLVPDRRERTPVGA